MSSILDSESTKCYFLFLDFNISESCPMLVLGVHIANATKTQRAMFTEQGKLALEHSSIKVPMGGVWFTDNYAH